MSYDDDHPCWKCNTRTATCHADCERYEKAVQRNRERLRKENMQAASINAITATKVKAADNWRRHNRPARQKEG